MKDLRSGIEHLKQAKTLMSEANRIMSDHVSKLKTLEEENAELKAELDDWKGNAEGFQPDAYMKLPVDADGVPIRIGDEMDVDGDAMTVVGYRLYDGTLFLIVKESGSNCTYSPKPSGVRHFKCDPPDSWEKLEEDAKKHVCSYFGIDQDTASCKDCPHGSKRTGRTCWQDARLDMVARAKKLAGIEKLEGEER